MENISKNLTNLVLILGLFLPANNTVSLLLNALLPIILLFGTPLFDKYRFELISKIIVLVLIISFLGNYLFLHYHYNFKSIARGVNLVLLFSLFPLNTFRLSNKVLLCSILFILFSQLSFVFNFKSFLEIIDTFYPYTGTEVYYTTKFITTSASRFGGIYRNPNQCSRYVSFLFMTYMINKRSIDRGSLTCILVSLVSLLLCGSRTGFVVFLAFCLFFFIGRLGFLRMLPFILFCPLLIILGAQFFEFKYRAFELDTAVEGSLSQKIIWFCMFFDHLSNWFRICFGHGSSELLSLYDDSIMLDSEWGEFFFNIGFIGCTAYLFFLIKCFFTVNMKYRPFFIFLLWAISSTIIFSFRMSFLFVLVLSLIYNNSLNSEQ
ncbi:MAG: hypothetical protein N4A50_05500 [Vallitalea sp.]|jgi:hypothetical protein|nr:hypothetical protein [Vallitalea sp.]